MNKKFLVMFYNSVEESIIEHELTADSKEAAIKKGLNWIKNFDKVNPNAYEVYKVVEL